MYNDTISTEKCKTKSINLHSFQESLLVIAIFILMFCILTNPSFYAKSVTNGINLFFHAVLPGLLPFMFLCKMLANFQFKRLSRLFKQPMKKCFGLSEFCFFPFFISIISGYPIGSKITADLYAQGKIPKNDVFLCSILSSTSGLIFIIGSVGSIMLNSAKIGIILYISNILACIISVVLLHIFKTAKQKTSNKLKTANNTFMPTQNQTFYDLNKKQNQKTLKNNTISVLTASPLPLTAQIRINKSFSELPNASHNKNPNLLKSSITAKAEALKAHQNNANTNKHKMQQSFLNLMSQSAIDTTSSLLVVCFYIAFFFVIIDILSNLKILSFLSNIICAIIGSTPDKTALSTGIMSGIVEMTNGVKLLSNSINKTSISFISGLISFGGFSIIFQSLSFLSKTQIKAQKFILAKLFQALLSFLICFIILSLFPIL